MLDQNIVTLLSALIGGLLPITGGLIANHYLNSTTKKSDREKKIRNIIEQAYREVQSIEKFHDDAVNITVEYEHGHKPDIDDEYEVSRWNKKYDSDIEKISDEIKNSLRKLDLLINLYMPKLEKDFLDYQESMKTILLFMSASMVKIDDESIEKFTSINRHFQESLSKILKKEGYSYL